MLAAVLLVGGVLTGLAANEQTPDQVLVTATPLQAIIATSTPPATGLAIATSTSTPTPTPAGAILLQARESAGSVNVRAEPNPDSQRLGSISYGDTYPIIGRYFRWLQFQYDLSPTGRGWVFDELVDIIGDASQIQDINLLAEATLDTSLFDATLTFEAITQTPGGVLTATAQSRVLIAPTRIPAGAAETNPDGGEVLPTYTYPPGVSLQPPEPGGAFITGDNTTAEAAPAAQMPSTIPPIAVVLGLGILGLAGLFISSLRR